MAGLVTYFLQAVEIGIHVPIKFRISMLIFHGLSLSACNCTIRQPEISLHLILSDKAKLVNIKALEISRLCNSVQRFEKINRL